MGQAMGQAMGEEGSVAAQKIRAYARLALLWVGRHMSVSRLHDARNALGALTLGRWLTDNPAASGSKVARRAEKTEVYLDAIARVTGTNPLYLEFGVWEGWSLRFWLEHLTMPGARFVGFDSFEGLPEQWRPDYPPGTFAVGAPPPITDERVSFQVGWFDKTLPTFEVPEHDQLIVNVDCTLYSSTATVLTALERHLRAGDLIYFDELPEYDHELRAFLEHQERIDLKLVPISHSRGYYWLFQYAAST
jgi:hypothetical protein